MLALWQGASPGRRIAASSLIVVGALLAVAALVVWLWPGSLALLGFPAPTGLDFERVLNARDPAALAQPIGIASDGHHVFVADAQRAEIVEFAEDGSLVRAFGKGILGVPVYIALNPLDGRLYVTDRGRHAIFAFTSSGQFLRRLQPRLLPGASPVAWQPVGIGFAHNGTGYVTDVGGQRVLRLSADGQSCSVVATAAPSDGSPAPLAFPNGVAASESTVVVSDSNNARLLVMPVGGGPALSIRTGGLPRGVVLLSGEGLNVAVVVDTMAGTLQAFRTDGAQLAGLGAARGGGHPLRFPTGIAAGSDGTLYVSETGNARVQVWRANLAILSGDERSLASRGFLPLVLVTLGIVSLGGSFLCLYLRRNLGAAV